MGADHFITGLRLRMADLELDPAATCQMHTRKEDGARCEENLDHKGEHTLKCNKGRARFGPHRAIEVSLQGCAKDYGRFADKERIVPDLYKVEDGKIKEAILDVVIRAPANPRSRFIDVTIRCPHRKGKDHGEKAGAMAQLGEGDKERRYGVQAMPIAFESYGRMSEESRHNLRQVAWDAAMVQKRAIDKPTADIYAEGRLKLERTLILELAAIALCCMGRWAPKLNGS